MADDDDLMNNAIRVRAWAIRRTGELLKEIEKKQGQRTDLQLSMPERTRWQVATEAGLTKHKRDTVLRVATIPEEEFEEAVESDDPPTLTALAERGTVKKPPVHVEHLVMET